MECGLEKISTPPTLLPYYVTENLLKTFDFNASYLMPSFGLVFLAIQAPYRRAIWTKKIFTKIKKN